MLQGIDLDAIRKYNTDLKQYRDKAANLNAEIEYTTKELNSLCEELTKELGKPVTKDNIEQIYTEQVQAIQSTLQSGTAVLARIASEEQNLNSMQTNQATVQPTVQQPVAPTQPVYTTPVAPAQPAQAVQPQVATSPTPVMPPPVTGSIFNGQSAQLGTQQGNSALPPLFSL